MNCTYRVQSGDTIQSIAQLYGIGVRELLDLNPGLRSEFGLIPTQIINVPCRPNNNCETVTRQGETVGQVLDRLGANFEVAREIRLVGNQIVYNPSVLNPIRTFEGETVANIISRLGNVTDKLAAVSNLRVIAGQVVVNPFCQTPCEATTRPDDTVGRLLDRGLSLELVRSLFLIPGQPIGGCQPFPPRPLPIDTGCYALLEQAFGILKLSDGNLRPEELAIGLVRLRPSRYQPFGQFHESILRVPVLIIANDRFNNPFTGKQVPAANLVRLQPDTWEVVQPVIGDIVQRNISVYDLSSVIAFLSQDTNFKSDCAANISKAYNPRCLGLLESLDYLEDPIIYPATFMAQVDSVYVRKPFLPDAIIPTWVSTLGGTTVSKIVNGNIVERIVTVSVVALYNYYSATGDRTCVPNGLLNETATFQEQLALDEQMAAAVPTSIRREARALTFGDTLAANNISDNAYLRDISNLGNNPTEINARIQLNANTALTGSSGINPNFVTGYNNSSVAPQPNPMTAGGTQAYLSSSDCPNGVIPGPGGVGFVCFNPNV